MTVDSNKKASLAASGSVANALAILQYLSRASVPEGVTAIARTLGLSPSSCFNILKTLAAKGFVEFDTVSKRYRLGWAPILLARRALNGDGLLTLLYPAMMQFAGRHDVACGLGRVTRDEHVVLIGFAESATSTRIHLTIGQRVPLLAGASGRSVAAHLRLPQDQIKRRFEALRWDVAPTFSTYLTQVADARRRGWSIDADQAYRGITTMAAPLCDGSGTAQYVLSATLFSGQKSRSELEAIGEELARLARSSAHGFFDTAAEPGNSEPVVKKPRGRRAIGTPGRPQTRPAIKASSGPRR